MPEPAPSPAKNTRLRPAPALAPATLHECTVRNWKLFLFLKVLNIIFAKSLMFDLLGCLTCVLIVSSHCQGYAYTVCTQYALICICSIPTCLAGVQYIYIYTGGIETERGLLLLLQLIKTRNVWQIWSEIIHPDKPDGGVPIQNCCDRSHRLLY